MTNILEVKKINKSLFINGTEKILLKDINLIIQKGEFICIAGPSGCGKTTILELIAGFQQPDNGMVLQENRKISKPESSRIMIFQDFNQLFPWKTTYENIKFPLKKLRKNLSDPEMDVMVGNALKMVKLGDYGSYYPHQLSGGMTQRAAIARALVLNPEILLMDAPFGSLDAQTRSQLQMLLADIWGETGVTIIFVTHDIQEAILLADRIVIMDKNPGSIKTVIKNDIPKPRNIMGNECMAVYGKILNMLKNNE